MQDTVRGAKGVGSRLDQISKNIDDLHPGRTAAAE
jgi:hypothetical protein